MAAAIRELDDLLRVNLRNGARFARYFFGTAEAVPLRNTAVATVA
jgi:hypothetical protein